MSHVFISYGRVESRFALKLAAGLRNGGASVWIDKLPEGIRPGDDWPKTIEGAIDRCSAFVAVVSPDYLSSRVCRRELARADQLTRQLFPVLIAPIQTIEWPLELQRLQYIDFTGWLDDRIFDSKLGLLLDRLISEAGEAIGQRPDTEEQCLLTLIAALEARRGVAEYIPLEADLETTREPKGYSTITHSLGLDPEFSLLEQRAGSTSFSNQETASVERAHIKDVRQMIESGKPFALLGDSGCGKTTTLRRLALEAARTRLVDRRAPFPLLLSLSEWPANTDIIGFASSRWPFSADFRTAAHNGDVLILLDGLNEMGQGAKLRVASLKQWLSSGLRPKRLVVTCRSSDYGDALCLDIDKITALPLTRQQVQAFADSHLGQQAQTFVDELQQCSPPARSDDTVMNLASNPYLLICIAVIFLASPDRRLPRNAGTVISLVVEQLWNRELIRRTEGWVPLPEFSACLGALAFEIAQQQLPLSMDKENALVFIRTESLLHAAVNASLLDANTRSVAFSHQMIMEYFAAVELDRRFPRGNRTGVTNVSPRRNQEYLSRLVGPFGSVTRVASESVMKVEHRRRWAPIFASLAAIVDDPDTLMVDVGCEDPIIAAMAFAKGVDIDLGSWRTLIDALLDNWLYCSEQIQAVDRINERKLREAAGGRGIWKLNHLRLLVDSQKKAYFHAKYQIASFIDTAAKLVLPVLKEVALGSDHGKAAAARDILDWVNTPAAKSVLNEVTAISQQTKNSF